MGFAFAHVSTRALELFHGVQGSYELWTSSHLSTPVTGTHHLKLTILGASDKAVVPNAEVSLTLTSPTGTKRTYDAMPGTHASFFEVDVPLEQTGRWRFEVGVQRPSGRESVSFSRRIFTPLQLQLLPLAIFAVSVCLLALLGFGKLDFLFGGKRGHRLLQAPPKRKVVQETLDGARLSEL